MTFKNFKVKIRNYLFFNLKLNESKYQIEYIYKRRIFMLFT
jgi:hypothetical protein